MESQYSLLDIVSIKMYCGGYHKDQFYQNYNYVLCECWFELMFFNISNINKEQKEEKVKQK